MIPVKSECSCVIATESKPHSFVHLRPTIQEVEKENVRLLQHKHKATGLKDAFQGGGPSY